MPRFHIEIDVECETQQEAEAWADALTTVADTSEVTPSDEGWLVTENPRGQLPGGPIPPEFLQVMFAHGQVIDAFKQWLAGQGMVLRKIPRFDEPAHHYVPTHFITPNDHVMRVAGFNVPEGQQ